MNPPDLQALKLNAHGEGWQTAELKFDLADVPETASIIIQAFAGYSAFLNGRFLGSDEFSTRTAYRISSCLRIGENHLQVNVFSLEGKGWFILQPFGMDVDISTSAPGWRWLSDEEKPKQAISPCVRGSAEEPWDGGGLVFNNIPTVTERPAFVVDTSKANPAQMFPEAHCLIRVSEGEKIGFENEIVFDFGQETVGHAEACIRCDTNLALTLSFAESYDHIDLNPWWHAQDSFPLKKGVNKIFDTSRKGFRYLKMSADKPARMTVLDIKNHRPALPLSNRGFFRCSDDFVNKVNEVSCRTVELCSQRFLEDGIRRDRLTWTGDLRPEALVMYRQLGEIDIVRDSLYCFARHTNEHGVIQPAYPWRTGWVMTDYVMWWIISLWEYFTHTLDMETLSELAPVAFEQEKWLRSRLDERGLIITQAENGAPITCWSSRDREGFTSYANCLWFETRDILGNMRRLTGDNDSERLSSDRNVWRQFLREMFVDGKGRWRDLDTEDRFRPEVPHDGNINAAMFGVPTLLAEKSKNTGFLVQKTLKKLEKEGWTNYGSPVWWSAGDESPNEKQNRIMPLYNAYEIEQRIIWSPAKAYELMRRCFGHMLNAGATTFWEAIDLSGSPGMDSAGQSAGFTSLCHGWSGYLAAVFPNLLISPFRPGFWNLDFAEAGIPAGNELALYRVEWDKKSLVWRYSGYIPRGQRSEATEIGFLPFSPNEAKKITTSGCSLDKKSAKQNILYVDDVKPGSHFEVTVKLHKEAIGD